jgi:SAM-dependent methyltransferase
MIMESSEQAIPEAEAGGFVPTLNGMGYMTVTCDRFMREFVSFAGSCTHPVLDIGAAYGVATIAALESGATVIANDLDERHLILMRNSLAPRLSSRLVTIPGHFPRDLRFYANSLGAILIARVLHFFDGDLLTASVQRAYDWLVPGGRIFVTAETPYLKNLQIFTRVYEERKKAGSQWPGFLDDVQSMVPRRGAHLPKTMHFLDPDVLSRVFTESGFRIDEATMFARPEFPEDIQLDGRESVGLIATKL